MIATKENIDDILLKQLRKINNNVTSDKTKHVEAEKELINLSKMFHKYQQKNINFLLRVKSYQTRSDNYQNSLVFSTMLNSLTLCNKKANSWKLSGIYFKKIKTFIIDFSKANRKFSFELLLQ